MAKDETKEEKKEILVVAQLPTQQMRVGLGEDGKQYEFVTIEEALTEILTEVRTISSRIKKIA